MGGNLLAYFFGPPCRYRIEKTKPRASECPGVKNYKWRGLTRSGTECIHSCTHMATVGVKGLTNSRQSGTRSGNSQGAAQFPSGCLKCGTKSSAESIIGPYGLWSPYIDRGLVISKVSSFSLLVSIPSPVPTPTPVASPLAEKFATSQYGITVFHLDPPLHCCASIWAFLPRDAL